MLSPWYHFVECFMLQALFLKMKFDGPLVVPTASPLPNSPQFPLSPGPLCKLFIVIVQPHPKLEASFLLPGRVSPMSSFFKASKQASNEPEVCECALLGLCVHTHKKHLLFPPVMPSEIAKGGDDCFGCHVKGKQIEVAPELLICSLQYFSACHKKNCTMACALSPEVSTFL